MQISIPRAPTTATQNTLCGKYTARRTFHSASKHNKLIEILGIGSSQSNRSCPSDSGSRQQHIIIITAIITNTNIIIKHVHGKRGSISIGFFVRTSMDMLCIHIFTLCHWSAVAAWMCVCVWTKRRPEIHCAPNAGHIVEVVAGKARPSEAVWIRLPIDIVFCVVFTRRVFQSTFAHSSRVERRCVGGVVKKKRVKGSVRVADSVTIFYVKSKIMRVARDSVNNEVCLWMQNWWTTLAMSNGFARLSRYVNHRKFVCSCLSYWF